MRSQQQLSDLAKDQGLAPSAAVPWGAPERKWLGEAQLSLSGEQVIEGYASLFGRVDQGGDMVLPGAYGASLANRAKAAAVEGNRPAVGRVRMLWQHDPGAPIGVWDELREDARGLWVKGRLLTGPQPCWLRARSRACRSAIARCGPSVTRPAFADWPRSTFGKCRL
jgi:hypothetical protein